MFYSIIGIALLLLSAVTIACMVVFEVRDHKVGKPLPETFNREKDFRKSRIPRRFWMLFPEPMNLLVHYGGC